MPGISCPKSHPVYCRSIWRARYRRHDCTASSCQVVVEGDRLPLYDPARACVVSSTSSTMLESGVVPGQIHEI